MGYDELFESALGIVMRDCLPDFVQCGLRLGQNALGQGIEHIAGLLHQQRC